MMRMTRLLHRRSEKNSSRLWTNRMARFHAPPEAPSSSKPRIVILSASVGAGHVRAAQAIECALAHSLPDATIAHVDVLKLTNPVFRRAYSAGYFRAVDAGMRKKVDALFASKVRPIDSRLKELRDQVAFVQRPISLDPALAGLRHDIETSAQQAATQRLTAIQDIAWALINSPAFLFNH